MNSYDELLVPPDPEGLSRCAQLLREGGLVAFPTETVYGLGANALNEEAVHSIFRAKGRPLTDPLIVHVTDQAAANALLDINDEEAAVFQSLSSTFWPGPLTLIAKASKVIPAAVTAGTGFVGVRAPAHTLAMDLLKASNLPIAAPSANRFGHVSPTRAHHVLYDLADKGVHVLNGDGDAYAAFTCQHGIESTVAKINGNLHQVQIFRQGAVTQPMIEKALQGCGLAPQWTVTLVSRTVNMSHAHTNSNSNTNSNNLNSAQTQKIAECDESNSHNNSTTIPMTKKNEGDEGGDDDDVSRKQEQDQQQQSVGQEAPGQAITHYAPDVPCFIVASLVIGEPSVSCTPSSSTADNKLPITSTMTQSELRSVVIIDFAGQMNQLSSSCLAYRDLSATGCSVEGARNLFETLRWAELVPGANKILLPYISPALSGGGPEETHVSEDITDAAVAKADLILGLTDRIFRAASGVSINLTLTSLEDK